MNEYDSNRIYDLVATIGFIKTKIVNHCKGLHKSWFFWLSVLWYVIVIIVWLTLGDK